MSLADLLDDPSVPHHNNDCERSLHSSFMHRKITCGFRSEWGPNAYVALASVIDTAKLQRRSVFETLVNLMGQPVFPFLAAASRVTRRLQKWARANPARCVFHKMSLLNTESNAKNAAPQKESGVFVET